MQINTQQHLQAVHIVIYQQRKNTKVAEETDKNDTKIQLKMSSKPGQGKADGSKGRGRGIPKL